MSDDSNEFGEVAEISEEELGGDINPVSDEDEVVDDEDIIDDFSADESFEAVKEEEEEDPYMDEMEEILDPNDTNGWDDR